MSGKSGSVPSKEQEYYLVFAIDLHSNESKTSVKKSSDLHYSLIYYICTHLSRYRKHFIYI